MALNPDGSDAEASTPPGPRIGWHASHEQIHPRALLTAARHAEAVGFTDAMCSDHLAPWSSSQGQSAFAFAWLGAALEATKTLRFGQFHAPGQRYHPVISAQAIATLAAMYPGRYPWVALGSGENLNEHVTGDLWPPKPIREERLRQAVAVMRDLLDGKTVTHDDLVRADRAQLWTLPDVAPMLVAGAVSPRTAAWAAGWADGLITVNTSPAKVREVVSAYRDAGGKGSVSIQVHLSWAGTEQDALAIAMHQWKAMCVPATVTWDLALPEDFEAASRTAGEADVRAAVLVTADLARLSGLLSEYLDTGADGLYLHHVGQEQRPFLDACGDRLLADLRSAGRS